MAFAKPGFLQGLGDLRREGGKEEGRRGGEYMIVETAYSPKLRTRQCKEEGKKRRMEGGVVVMEAVFSSSLT